MAGTPSACWATAHWVELAHSASGFLGGRARWRLAGYNLAAPDAPTDEPRVDFVSDQPARYDS